MFVSPPMGMVILHLQNGLKICWRNEASEVKAWPENHILHTMK